jgi:uncharacterized membrane protein YuzA (DUF378 family)
MKSSTRFYLRVKMHMVLVALVIIGALNWGSSVFGYNLVEILNFHINQLVGYQTNLNKMIYIAIALAALRLALKKTTWLPFLGYSAFPSQSLVPNKYNSIGNTIIKVNVKPNTRVAYWASLPRQTSEIPLVEQAYGKFENSGVVLSDNNGIAELLVLPGTEYIVPSGRVIKRHVHYRELDLHTGMMGRLETVYY